MSYLFETRFGLSQAHFARVRLIDAIKQGMSFNQYQSQQITAGTGYKRLDMLADWNRGKVVERSKRSEPRARLVRYYDEVAMPVMEKMKITPTKFFEYKYEGIDMEDISSEDYVQWLLEEQEEEDYRKEMYAAAF